MPETSNWEIETANSSSVEAMGLRHALSFLLRNSPIIILGLLIGVGIGLTLQKITPTAYDSEGKFVVDDLPFSKQPDTPMDAETGRQLVQTLILSVGSRDMATAVAKQLKIPMERLSFEGIDIPLKLKGTVPQANIVVTATKESRIGVVTVTSQSAQFAADVVNAILDQMQLYNQVGGLLKQLRFNMSLSSTMADSILSQIVGLSEKRITLQQQNVELAAYIARGLPLESFTAFSADPTLTNMKTQLALVQSEYDSIASTSTMGPRLAGKKSELEGLKIQMADHAKTLAGAMKSDYEIMATRETNLKSELAKTQDEIQKNNDFSAQLVQSFGDPAAMRKISAQYTGPASTGNVIVVVDHGSPSKLPSKPKLSLNLAIGIVLGGVLGFVVAALTALLDRRLHSIEMVEQKTGVACLAMLPRLDPIEKRKDIFHRSRSPLGLGYLRSHFLRASIETSGQKIIAFSPSRRGGDASRLVADLAILLTQSNKRTLVIDLQRNRPKIASMLGVPEKDGLTKWLSSQSPLESCVSYSSKKELGVLGLGKIDSDLDNLFGSRPLALELPSLNQTWDFILVNAPPIRFDWTTMLTLPTQSTVIITADYRTSRADDVTNTALRARNSRWKIEGVVLLNCPTRLTGARAL